MDLFNEKKKKKKKKKLCNVIMLHNSNFIKEKGANKAGPIVGVFKRRFIYLLHNTVA